MQAAECPDTMDPTLAPNLLSWMLPLPLLGDGLCSGPPVMQIENSAIAALFDKSDVYFSVDVGAGGTHN